LSQILGANAKIAFINQHSMAHFTPDYEHLYMQEEFADVQLVIQDESEATTAGQKRKRKATAHTLPGHCVLLLGHSGYCKAKASSLLLPRHEQSSSLVHTQ
jgi:hypothetical protein